LFGLQQGIELQNPKGDLTMNTIRPSLGVRLLLIGAAATLISPSISAEPSTVTVTVNGLRSQSGTIAVCLWRQQDDGFPLCSDTASFAYATTGATASTVTMTFQNIPPGDYALSAFHDENQNGRLDRGFMGRPEEGIALSNMNMERRERPSFEQAKFTLNGTQTLSLSLRYF
jgi:uncharacterized protein (DUF2141 family)